VIAGLSSRAVTSRRPQIARAASKMTISAWCVWCCVCVCGVGGRGAAGCAMSAAAHAYTRGLSRGAAWPRTCT
jgi:hypothetical protein